jgi:hypothetical protein
MEKNLLKSGGMEDQDTDETITLKRKKTVHGTVTSDKIKPQLWSSPSKTEWR